MADTKRDVMRTSKTGIYRPTKTVWRQAFRSPAGESHMQDFPTREEAIGYPTFFSKVGNPIEVTQYLNDDGSWSDE